MSQLVEDILIEHGGFSFDTLGGDHDFLCVLKYKAPPVGDRQHALLNQIITDL